MEQVAGRRPFSNVPRSERTKLPKVPQTHKIAKRPLLHAAIASPLTSSTTARKIIYVSTKSPFVAIIKRAQVYLAQIQRREEGGVDVHDLLHRKRGVGAGAAAAAVAVAGNGLADRPLRKGGDDVGEEVIVAGTGKAIEQVLAVALFFQAGGDAGDGTAGGAGGYEEGVQNLGRYTVRLTTKSIGAVDDVVPSGKVRRGKKGAKQARGEDGGGRKSGDDEGEAKGDEEAAEEARETPDEHMLSPGEVSADVDADVPETRLRRTSCLEVHIGLR